MVLTLRADSFFSFSFFVWEHCMQVLNFALSVRFLTSYLMYALVFNIQAFFIFKFFTCSRFLNMLDQGLLVLYVSRTFYLSCSRVLRFGFITLHPYSPCFPISIPCMPIIGFHHTPECFSFQSHVLG